MPSLKLFRNESGRVHAMKKKKTHLPFRAMTNARITSPRPAHSLAPLEERSSFKSASPSLDELMASPQRRRYLATLGDGQEAA